jgi:2-keto-3-deoxy-L-rhamnonate aldolase RhmA
VASPKTLKQRLLDGDEIRSLRLPMSHSREQVQAAENIEAILDVEGLDMVQFGGGDYSVSIGQPGGGHGEDTRGA